MTDRLVALMRTHLVAPDDVAAALVAVGTGWADIQVRFAREFALIPRVRNEVAGAVPDEVLQRWQDAASDRAQSELGRHLDALTAAGLLRTFDPERSANQFIWLVLGEASTRGQYGAAPLADAELEDLIASGVDTFLHGQAPLHRAV